MAEEESITYEMLQDLLRSERRTNKLMPLPASFWPRAQEFLASATEAFRVEQARDPFGRDVIQLTDRVKNARHAAASLWALRERKIAMLGLAQTPKGKVPEGATPDESLLYAELVQVLDAARRRVLADLQAPVAGALTAGGLAPNVPSAPPPPTRSLTGATPAVHAPAAAQAPLPPPAPALQVPVVDAAPAPPVTVPADVRSGGVEMVTIRALGDIPAFVGPDMQTYLLKEGDVASVPQSIANLLARRKKAAVIEA